MAIPPFFSNSNLGCSAGGGGGGGPLAYEIPLGYTANLDCDPGSSIFTTRIQGLGGVQPYVWTINQGYLEELSNDLVQISINGINGNLSFGGMGGPFFAAASLKFEFKGYKNIKLNHCGGGVHGLAVHMEQSSAFVGPTEYVVEALDCAGDIIDIDHWATANAVCNSSIFNPFDTDDPDTNILNILGCAQLGGGSFTVDAPPGALTNILTCCTAGTYTANFKGRVQVNNPGRGVLFVETPTCDIPEGPEVDDFFGCQTPHLDVRPQCMIDLGCSPCRLIEDTDIIVTLTDANLDSIPIIIHIDPIP